MKERAAPTATCSGAKALGQFADPPRFLHPNELLDFSPRDVEAKAQVVVRFHERNRCGGGRHQVML
ncbi:hypothetical protein-signal peptide prediction [Rhodopirellula baltica SH 1]|uniref:Uncharacterized protein n=1 Tax=Rhodopirellula baltica (strain DSM 10527 / NCIMB 13988 / SH1) TaxID=243090 RepID=Q7UNY7_RHOBA|nr:hypothetical protein-signal peptide prediction [Rhodopirellula baltica SH 1]